MAEARAEPLPRSGTFTRIALGIIVAVVVLHLSTSLYYGHEKMVAEAGVFAAGVAERALVVAGEDLAPELLEVLQTPVFSVRRQLEPAPPLQRVWPHSDETRAAVVARLRQLGFEDAERVRVQFASRRGDNHLLLQMPLAEGWLVVQALSPSASGHTALATFWMTLMTLVVLAVLLLATRRFTSYLPELALAAERVGRDHSLTLLKEQGPRELRRVSRAFNAMQKRVTALLDERNVMLGALSHDARTLVTRLALRLEKAADPELRAKAGEDLQAVTQLLDEALTFARDDASDEDPVDLDLPSLLQTLVDDESDRGAQASYSGPSSLVMSAQPLALRRAFVNLIDNAIRYGGAVRVELARRDGDVVVDVLDPGPGIPASERDRALKPYERLDTSRSRATGGTGLGLAIVANVVRRHHGCLELGGVESGFRVRLVLPDGQVPSRAQASHQK